MIVRFAPSPTGFLHLGSARTALFNWLAARSCGGRFLLRIEDTDKVRSEQRFLDEILEDLTLARPGLGRGADLPEPPLRPLPGQGRGARGRRARPTGRARPSSSGSSPAGRSPSTTSSTAASPSRPRTIKDQVLIKSDGSPAYNFCCVVDDADLGITHILRGDDHISNTPKQILFYEAFGLTPPRFGHMPLILGPDGAKLSKRHGGVSVTEYKAEGFLPEALANYLILLGWTPPGRPGDPAPGRGGPALRDRRT